MWYDKEVQSTNFGEHLCFPTPKKLVDWTKLPPKKARASFLHSWLNFSTGSQPFIRLLGTILMLANFWKILRKKTISFNYVGKRIIASKKRTHSSRNATFCQENTVCFAMKKEECVNECLKLCLGNDRQRDSNPLPLTSLPRRHFTCMCFTRHQRFCGQSARHEQNPALEKTTTTEMNIFLPSFFPRNLSRVTASLQSFQLQILKY